VIVGESDPFTWIGGNLLKLGPYQILRRCVRKEEVFDILVGKPSYLFMFSTTGLLYIKM